MECTNKNYIFDLYFFGYAIALNANPWKNMRYVLKHWEAAASHAILAFAGALQVALVLRLAGQI